MPHTNFVQPVDGNGKAVPTLLDSGVRTQVTTAGAATSAATALPASAQVAFIRATATCYINFGDAAVAATADANSQLFIQGETLQPLPRAATHFAVIRIGADDVTVQIARAS